MQASVTTKSDETIIFTRCQEENVYLRVGRLESRRSSQTLYESPARAPLGTLVPRDHQNRLHEQSLKSHT